MWAMKPCPLTRLRVEQVLIALSAFQPDWGLSKRCTEGRIARQDLDTLLVPLNYEGDWQNRLTPRQACVEVELEQLLADPASFDSQMICSSGLATARWNERGYYHQSELWPENEAGISKLAFGPITILDLPYEPSGPLEFEAMPINFIGYFNTWEECFHLGIPSPSPNPDNPMECKPTMELDILEIEYLDR